MPSLRCGAGAVVSDINGERLLADLRALAAIGGLPDGGVDRLAWAEHDMAGGGWVPERLREAGIEGRVGGGPNRLGPLPGTRGAPGASGPHTRHGPHRRPPRLCPRRRFGA